MTKNYTRFDYMTVRLVDAAVWTAISAHMAHLSMERHSVLDQCLAILFALKAFGSLSEFATAGIRGMPCK